MGKERESIRTCMAYLRPQVRECGSAGWKWVRALAWGVMCSHVLLQGKDSGEPACAAVVKVVHHQYFNKTQWLFACLPNLYASLADGNNRQAVKLWDVSTKCSASYGFLPCCVLLLWDSGNFVSLSHTIRSDPPPQAPAT